MNWKTSFNKKKIIKLCLANLYANVCKDKKIIHLREFYEEIKKNVLISLNIYKN
jgi:hypothetical protein